MKYLSAFLCFSILLVSAFSAQAAKENGKFSKLGYVAQILEGPVLEISEPKFPDISSYTVKNLIKKFPSLTAGKVIIRSLEGLPGSDQFLRDGGARRLKLLQGGAPKIIVIKDGVYTPQMIAEELNDDSLVQCDETSCLFKKPLYVGRNASLVLKADMHLKLSAGAGSFLLVAGGLYSVSARIEGWDARNNKTASFTEKTIFRPFITVWNGAKVYIARTHLYNLGYASTKSYGLTFSSAKELEGETKLWLLENKIEGLFYGFYTYEANNLIILRNTFTGNIVYGIDPHDRSEGLVIAYNDVTDTKEKHGIILSREVNKSWVFHNKSYRNKGSGIMIDRSSAGNIVAYNVSEENGLEGISISESAHTHLYKNTIRKNKKNGIRVRNSWDFVSYRDSVKDNTHHGIKAYTTSLEHLERDFVLDPYVQKLEISIVQSKFSGNTKGIMKVSDADRIILSGIEADMDEVETFFGGDLGFFEGEVSAHALDKKKTVELVNFKNLPNKIKK